MKCFCLKCTFVLNTGYWIAEVTKTSVAAVGEEWESNSIIALHRLSASVMGGADLCLKCAPSILPVIILTLDTWGVQKLYLNMYDVLRTINQYFYFIYKYFFPLCKIFFKIKIQ